MEHGVHENVGVPGMVAGLLGIVNDASFAAEAIFVKALTANDDSGRHGVLIPREAYVLFPPLGAEVDAGDWNPRKPIGTSWRDRTGWSRKDSNFIHYNRYPERRITSLLPAAVNGAGERVMLVAKARDAYEYRCVVASPTGGDWNLLYGCLAESGPVLEGSFRLFSAGASGATSPVYEELLARLRAIAAMGWVRTVRAGDTGVGMTLEHLLGLAPNAKEAPDYKGIELKAKRVGTKTGTRRTLFAKTPEWGAGGRAALLDAHGAADVNGRFSIYQSMYAHRESRDGWRLQYDPAEERLWVLRRGQRVVSWKRSTLASRLEAKHRETVFVYANFRGTGAEEEVHFTKATHAVGANLDRYLKVLADGGGCHDFAMHRRDNGSVRDHGFLFRVDELSLPSVFSEVTAVSLEPSE